MHRLHLDAENVVQQLTREMGIGTYAGRGVENLTSLCLVLQVLQRRDGYARASDDELVTKGHDADRLQVFHRIERQVLLRRCICGEAARNEHHRVPVRPCPGHVSHAYRRACARPILDNDGLFPELLEAISEVAADDVVGSTGWERNDDCHRP